MLLELGFTMFTYVCGCFCWKMAVLNTCSRGQIFYRAYSIYCLAIHRKGLLPSGLKAKGQGEETIEIILLGGERWKIQLARAGIAVCEPSEFGPLPSSAPITHILGWLLPDSDLPVTSLIQASAHIPVWKPFY